MPPSPDYAISTFAARRAPIATPSRVISASPRVSRAAFGEANAWEELRVLARPPHRLDVIGEGAPQVDPVPVAGQDQRQRRPPAAVADHRHPCLSHPCSSLRRQSAINTQRPSEEGEPRWLVLQSYLSRSLSSALSAWGFGSHWRVGHGVAWICLMAMAAQTRSLLSAGLSVSLAFRLPAALRSAGRAALAAGPMAPSAEAALARTS